MTNRPPQRKKIKQAIQDSNLQTALERCAKAYGAARAEVMKEIDFEALRAEVRELKERCIARQPELVERFKREAERVNAVVYEAKTPEDANRYVAELAHERGVEMIVKSKSMLTEEIDLNAYLEKQGLKVVETDLGEWIIQLAGEKPSHFTQPSAHKTREQVAELFSKVVGRKVEPDIPTLVEVARNELRRAFVDAQMGISGANIAIAETGSVVIVTNEGNSRLVTTLPPIHVAIVGYEKLVETLDDANSIIKLLAKSGTGQKMTAYVSYITGPSRTTDIEKTLTIGVHGPKEVHIILVDNGRTKMREDEDCAEALYCLKCGACLNVCPPYRSIGGHVYANSYIGGIGSVLTAFHDDLESAEGTLGLCNGCGMCVSVCPAKIDTPAMTLALRQRAVERSGLSAGDRLKFMMFSDLRTLENAARMARAARIPMLLAKPFLNQTSIAPNFLRMGLAFSGKPLRTCLPEVMKPEGKTVAKAAFFAGCLIDAMYPEIGEAVCEVLTRLGVEVSFPKSQVCCGAPMLYAGDRETAKELAFRNVDALADADYIITTCPTCAIALKEYLPRILHGTKGERRAREISERVKDFNEYLINVIQADKTIPELLVPNSEKIRITYHDPCHLNRGLGITSEPRQILTLAGLDLVEMPDSDVCCGFAGSHSFKYPDISESILRRKIENIVSVSPDIVATDCPGCILHLRGGMTTHRCPGEVRHTSQIIAERLKPKG